MPIIMPPNRTGEERQHELSPQDKADWIEFVKADMAADRAGTVPKWIRFLFNTSLAEAAYWIMIWASSTVPISHSMRYFPFLVFGSLLIAWISWILTSENKSW